MRRGLCLIIYAALAAALALQAGCAATDRPGPIVLGSPALLFDAPDAAYAATRFGRDPWPATLGRFEQVEETFFVDIYHDDSGSESLERTNPHRHFRSYRIGAQRR